MPKKVWLAVLLGLGLGILAFRAASAQTSPTQVPPPSDDQVNAVASQLYCPVCENIPLDVCPTQACAQWRDDIRQKLAQGWSGDKIKQYFVAQYGDRVLGTPPAHGINWLVYIIPPVAILAGVLILFSAFKAWTKARPAAEASAELSQEDDPYVRRLEEELKKR